MENKFYFEFTQSETDYIINGLHSLMECNNKADELTKSVNVRKAICEDQKVILSIIGRITTLTSYHHENG